MTASKCAIFVFNVERLDEVDVLAAHELEDIGDDTGSYESSGVIAVLLAEVYMGMLRSGVPDEAIKQNMAALIGHSVVSYEDILREKKNSFSKDIQKNIVTFENPE